MLDEARKRNCGSKFKDSKKDVKNFQSRAKYGSGYKNKSDDSAESNCQIVKSFIISEFENIVTVTKK